MLKRVLYSSHATHPRGHVSDIDILKTAQTFNADHGITGFLFRSNTHFFQVLEGEQSSLEALLNAVQSDPRHSSMKIHLYISTTGRIFNGWTMGYGDLTQPDALRVHGLVSRTGAPLIEALSELRALAERYV